MTSIPEKFDGTYYDKEQWLGGFFDAEGHIGTAPYKSSAYQIGYSLIPRIQINQAYVAGYFDGEGCLSPSILKVVGRATGFECEPNARINSTDHEVLDNIHLYLKEKGIISNVYFGKKKTAHTNAQKQLVVYGLENVERFLKLITPYLLTRKKEQAIVMLQYILPMMNEGKHLSKIGFVELMEYVDLLNSTKGGFKRSKYNSKYFRVLWRM